MSRDDESNSVSIVAIAPCCGHVVFAAGIERVKDFKSDIADLVCDGFAIVHWPTEKVRASKFGCDCKKGKK